MLSQFRFLSWTDVAIALVDIMVVSYLVYKFLTLIRGTRAVQLIKGIIILLVATSVTQWLRLYTINWLLVNARTMLFVALPVVFQPELRRALEQIGRGGFFSRALVFLEESAMLRLLDEIGRAVDSMSRNRIGALIVLERETGLGDYIDTGIKVDALVTAELLVNIFVPNTPLHDGAVIIRGDRVAAAACFLPLTDATDLGVEFGSRHRAALGITEHSDALAIVVSEQTGTISLADSGRLVRHLDGRGLKEMLGTLLKVKVKRHGGVR